MPPSLLLLLLLPQNVKLFRVGSKAKKYLFNSRIMCASCEEKQQAKYLIKSFETKEVYFCCAIAELTSQH